MPEQRRDTSGYEGVPKSTPVPETFPSDQRVDRNLVALRGPGVALEWSGRWESNPRGPRFRAFKTSDLARMLTPSVISV
jgi:hypothetical protein